ncbi:MAG: MarR family winged helix-turn-helix transcriptional regulator [Acidiferrobacterales bacterium]
MNSKRRVPESAIAQLIEQLGRCTWGDTFVQGLNPAQCTALRYFGRANRFSRTVGAFARYHGTTRGTASQTVKALVEKGYLRRRPDKRDHRTFRLDLTAKARKFVAQDPFHALVTAAAVLPSDRRFAVADGLQLMLDRLLTERRRPLFGVCTACAHLRAEDCCLNSATPYECGLLEEPLAEDDLAEMCVNYEPAVGPRVHSSP